MQDNKPNSNPSINSIETLKSQAAQGSMVAQFDLGICYEKGEGVKKDLKEAVRLYQLAADQGYAKAQNNLGNCYFNGEGVEKDRNEAARLYQLAAKQDNAVAQNNLGVCYEDGEGVAKDLKEAVRFYQLAATQGHADAQNNLGMCYDDGEGVEKDLKEAARLYRLAANQGHADAQTNLGACYEHGEGVEKNLKEAVRFYRLAAAQGNEEAQENLERNQGSTLLQKFSIFLGVAEALGTTALVISAPSLSDPTESLKIIRSLGPVGQALIKDVGNLNVGTTTGLIVNAVFWAVVAIMIYRARRIEATQPLTEDSQHFPSPQSQND